MGGLGMALAGGLEGLGRGLMEEARMRREEAAQRLRSRERRQERAEDRAFAVEDRNFRRGAAIEDRDLARTWSVEDREDQQRFQAGQSAASRAHSFAIEDYRRKGSREDEARRREQYLEDEARRRTQELEDEARRRGQALSDVERKAAYEREKEKLRQEHRLEELQERERIGLGSGRRDASDLRRGTLAELRKSFTDSSGFTNEEHLAIFVAEVLDNMDRDMTESEAVADARRRQIYERDVTVDPPGLLNKKTTTERKTGLGGDRRARWTGEFAPRGESSGEGRAPAPAAERPTASGPDGLPQPKTEAEYNALPKGSQYIDPDGKVRVKG